MFACGTDSIGFGRCEIMHHAVLVGAHGAEVNGDVIASQDVIGSQELQFCRINLIDNGKMMFMCDCRNDLYDVTGT